MWLMRPWQRSYSRKYPTLRARQVHPNISRFLSCALPCLDDDTELNGHRVNDVPECLFLGDSPQLLASLSWSGRSDTSRGSMGCVAVAGPMPSMVSRCESVSHRASAASLSAFFS